MKNVVRLLSVFLILAFTFGICACDDITDEWKKDPVKESKKTETAPKYSLEGEAGFYSGTYKETRYWNDGEVAERQETCFVFEYNGCYYLVERTDPKDTMEIYQKLGPEKYFARHFGKTKYDVSEGSYDVSTKTATYMVKSEISETQYLSKTYTLTFDGKGGISSTCKSMSVYKGEASMHEMVSFKGKKE